MYLKQEGLGEDRRWGFVDVGWRGRMQQYLASFVTEIGGNPPEGFYYALTAVPPSSSIYGTYHPYLGAQDYANGMPTIPEGLNNMIEMWCAGSHGLVLGYQLRQELMYPVLKAENNVTVQQWGLNFYRNVMKEFCVTLCGLKIPLRDHYLPKSMLCELIKIFWNKPTFIEAKVWGDFPLSDDQMDAKCPILAAPFELKNLWGEILPSSWNYRSKSFWKVGSLRKAPFLFRVLYFMSCSVAKLLRYIYKKRRFSCFQKHS
jgi:hypothetical protein